MHKRKIAAVTMAAIISNFSASTVSVLAHELENNKVVQSISNQNNQEIQPSEAKVSKFNLLNSSYLEEYDKSFKLDNSKITSITNNGGNYGSSVIYKAIDGNLSTHWETGKSNNSEFKNEVIFTLEEVTSLNRIVYGARQDGTKGKGFAQEFEVYTSLTDDGDDFNLVTRGGYKGSTGDIVEIKFNPTEFKRIKFKFTKANQDWASASEFMFYKKDVVQDKIDRLFTDETLSQVSEEFNTIEAINKLKEESKIHPLYEEFKEKIENAKILVNSNQEVEATDARIRKFDVFYTKNKENYENMFKMSNENIQNISTNGGNRGSYVKERMIDNNLDTFWETGRANSNEFKNEVVFKFKESIVLDRVIYRSHANTVGFADDFEIYASKTSEGDTFQLVTTGTPNRTSDLLEFKFNPTEFKRLKFIYNKSKANNATASEFMFYKEDVVSKKVESIFTDGTMSALKPEYNSLDAIEKLELEISNHPLKDKYTKIIELAKQILDGNVDYTESTFVLKQNGDTHTKAKNQLLMSSFGNDFQSTGIVAKPGEVFNIYVEVEDGAPTPEIVFTQQEGNYGNWRRNYRLKQGLNTITVPKIQDGGWAQKSNPGGAVYLVNKYTPDQQGKAPIVRIEGGEKFPLFNSGDNVEKFLEELKEYNARLNENPDTMVDIFESNSERLMFTGTAKAAYKVYINEGVDVNTSTDVWNKQFQQGFEFAGLKDDLSDPTNDSTNVRTAVRLMQPFGAAYAAGDHIGIQRHVMDVFLRTDTNSIKSMIWGTMHEAGHQMDIPARTWGEVTNNMWANQASIKIGKGDSVDYSSIFTNLSPEESLKGFEDFGYFDKLGMYWQLQIMKDTYWAELESMYRERRPKVANYQEKKDVLAKYSSEIMGVNLTKYYEKYKFTLSEECKAELSKLPDLEVKPWYLHTTAMNYKGNGFNKDINVSVKSKLNEEEKTSTLRFDIDNENKNDLLGYEIKKDGKVLGFTVGNSFVVKDVDLDKNTTYEVIAYAKDLSTAKGIIVNTFSPSISVQQDKILVALNRDFNANDLVYGSNYKGQDISSKINVSSNVDTSKKGTYEVNYTLKDNNIDVFKTIEVEVVSSFDYLSDSEWKSVTTQYGTPRRNSNIKGRVNGEIKTFDKGFGIHANGKITYDLSGKGYDNFEALLGVDMSMVSQNKSSITFKIVGDGKTLATTNVIKHEDNMVHINVPVNGVNELVIEVNDGGNGNSSDHSVIANPKLTTNNAKPTINASNKSLKLGNKLDIMENITATDPEDGNLTSIIEVESNNFKENKIGRFEVVYKVTDSNNNVTTKKIFVTVSEDYTVKKSKFGNFENLEQYNKEFKLPVESVSNNAGNYGSSVIANTIDGKMNTHWETNKPNSSSFNNEVIFDLGEVKGISKMAYASRRDAGGKGFAHEFEIYASDEAEGNDFYLVGEGTYRDRTTDVVEFNMNKVNARRIKFKFVEANQGWASLSEIAFYKADALSDKINNDLFTDANKTEVTERYNTLEKVEALREEVKNHPAFSLFEADLNKAKEIIIAKFPTLNVEETTLVKLNSEFDLMSSVVANDQEDGNIISKVQVNSDGFTISKAGKYTLTYTVTDSDSNTITKERNVIVYSKDSYVSDMNWESASSGWRSVTKDTAVASSNKIKLNVDGTVKEFDKGIGAATNAEIVYNLNGDYTHFTTYVGTDKNYNDNRTSIIFKIFADGKEVYTSDTIRKDSKSEFVSLDVTGVKEFKLVANDAGDGGLGDFASWADTKVYSTNSKPKLTIPKSVSTKVGQEIDLNEEYSAVDAEDGDITSSVEVIGKVNFNKPGKYPITYKVTDSDGNEVAKTRSVAVANMDDNKSLTDYDWKSTQNSYTAPVKDKSISGKTLRLTNENGQEVAYERGIGAHSTSTIIYDLTDKDYAYFTSYVGVDRQKFGSVGSVSFEVYVDGEKKFDSGLMNSRDAQKYVEVDINDAKELKLVVTDGGNGQGSDHATWGDTKLHFANNKEVNYQELEELVSKSNEYNKESYTEESFKVFEEALIKANVMLEDKISSQVEVNTMIEELNTAIENLEESVDLSEIVNINDRYLKSSIKKELNLSSDTITVGDMQKLTKLNVQHAESLEGLQYAKNLESLNIEYNGVNDLSPLKDLKKLTDLRAMYQNIAVGSIAKEDNKITINYDVLNRKGEKLSPKSVILRNNKTLEDTALNLDDCIDENGVISFDTTKLDASVYSVYLVYEDTNDNYLAQVLFMFNNK
ncbi:DUF5011 domain-containing protein [Romboutsia weinsteinii]|uniref:DUF5011 domain-containing protein n=1 Tax=Romboutsia weinsteinii TaxID=2020949 RepID=A0A371J3F6_9FIRM|nr:NPCBM/NEW2 domain-containing protein [Romboutsia weinsteinii]RDY27320.1 DUF5011 domain-containing protein [Romboutsia weinsteinii]